MEVMMAWLLDLGFSAKVEDAREDVYLLKLRPPDIFIDWFIHLDIFIEQWYVLLINREFAVLGSNQFNNLCGLMRTG